MLNSHYSTEPIGNGLFLEYTFFQFVANASQEYQNVMFWYNSTTSINKYIYDGTNLAGQRVCCYYATPC